MDWLVRSDILRSNYAEKKKHISLEHEINFFVGATCCLIVQSSGKFPKKKRKEKQKNLTSKEFFT